VGKTRLALEAVTETGSRYDQVAVVPLAPLAAPELVLTAIGAALGLPDMGHADAIDRIAATLRDAPALVLLDNFEHLEQAAPDVAELVTRCGQLTVLVTSRAPLGSRYEQELPVPPLPTPGAEIERPSDLLGYPSVRLFIDRARAINPALDPDQLDLPAVAEICRWLDGLPLAIELAAARTRVLSPRALLGRLTNHLDLLTGGTRDLPARQRTLRNAIAWSHDLLSPAEQDAFRRLAVFTGGFPLEGAEAVLAIPTTSAAGRNVQPPTTAVDLVEALARQSLLVTEVDGEDGSRFRMLATVQEFAREQLADSTDAVAAHRRHAAWCLHLAEEGSPALLGPEQRRWQSRLEREHANLRAALTWLRERGEVETALRLGSSLAHFWWFQGHYGQGRQELEALLALPGASTMGPWWAGTMTGLGMQLHKLGEYDRAITVHQDAIAAWRTLDLPAGLVTALWVLGYTLNSVDPGAAEPVFAESRDLAKATGQDWLHGASLWGLGVAAHRHGRVREAAELLTQSLLCARQLGNPLAVAGTLQSIGQVERERGHLEQATALVEEALILFRDHSVPWGVIGCLEDLAIIEQANRRSERATRLLGAAAALREKIGQALAPIDEPAHTRTITAIREALGEPRYAVRWQEGRAFRTPEAITYALADVLPTAP
jgi:non-specific serine/threonine protein kinase